MHLSDLPSGQEDDRWHQLRNLGSIRLKVLFEEYVILPVEEYSQLKEVILVWVCVVPAKPVC